MRDEPARNRVRPSRPDRLGPAGALPLGGGPFMLPAVNGRLGLLRDHHPVIVDQAPCGQRRRRMPAGRTVRSVLLDPVARDPHTDRDQGVDADARA